ncbi:MAG: extracellular solute-binding protein [Holosporales bacterium]
MTVFSWAAPSHAIVRYGEPRYAADFKHLEYVNPNAPKGGKVVYARQGTFDSLNPFIIKGTPAAGLSYLYGSMLHVTLMEHPNDEVLSGYGYAAESVELAADKKSITFTLRQGITFHDGTPIRAQDVVWSFQTLMGKGLPLYKGYWADIESCTALDARRVRFTFKTDQNPELPIIIGELPILSEAYYTKANFEKADLTPPVGSGPYRVKEVKPGQSITYERVANWWGEKLPIMVGRYNFQEIRFDYYRDDTVMFEAFKRGAYSVRFENSAKNWVTGYTFPDVRSGVVKKIEVADKNPEPMTGFAFNLRRDPFKDRRVRQALSVLYDFEWLNKNYFYGAYQQTSSYFQNSDMQSGTLPQGRELEILTAYKDKLLPEVFADFNPKPSPLRARLQQAQKLLEEAGYEIKDGVMVHTSSGKPLRFECLAVESPLVRVFEAFQRSLKRLGITMSIRLVDSAQYAERVDQFDFDVIWAGFQQSSSPGNEQREFWASTYAKQTGSLNVIGIENTVIDELIEKLIRAESREELIAYCRALDRVLRVEHYMIPGHHSPTTWIAHRQDIAFPAKVPDYGIDPSAWWHHTAENTKPNQPQDKATR